MEEIKRAQYKQINLTIMRFEKVKEQIIIKNEFIDEENRCKYKICSNKILQNNLISYKDYIKRYRNELVISQQEEKLYCDNAIVQNEEVINFLSQNKRNIFKNILKGFKKHIKNCSDIDLQRKYENLTEGKWNFQNIKSRIYQNLKIDGRCNLKMKSLLKSEKKSKIFKYFLMHSEKLWLEKSRLQNKEEYKKYISLILKANSNNLLVEKTQHYHKKKQSNYK